MAGEFEKLQPFKWRDDEYPISNIVFSLAHDLVEHKYWGVDGGRVEDTGVAPIRISVSMPLGNHIYPGVNETWKQGSLYPTALRKLFVDFALKSTGLCQHPEFGRISAKADRIECRLEAGKRGHAQVEASWIQTNDDTVNSVPRLNPTLDLVVAAGDLDGSDADLRALAPQLPKFEESFEDFARSIQAVGDQLALLSHRDAGRIDAIVYRAQLMQQSIDRARSALTWPATQNLERIKAAANGLRQKLLEAGKGIGLYTLANDTTLAGVQAQIPKSTGMGDIMRLNPHLCVKPIVPAGTAVRYYLAA